ncbi:LysR family transcriptional regulator [Enterobacter sp. J706]|uniref:LysR family transcriptional regulator n=1 Tax=Enterobacter sp. J706 TaxID=3444321 RepID=UPI003EB900B3
MRIRHIKSTDLNLLPAALVLLEERQVSRAADRYHLSQPAMSRVLQRLREVFRDELLVKGRNGFEPTLRGRHVLRELELLLPQLERLIQGENYDPSQATEHFRMAGTDYSLAVLGRVLFQRLYTKAPHISLDFTGWNDRVFDDLERGRLDLVLWASQVPDYLHREVLFEDEFVCVMAREHPAAQGELTLERYLSFPHVVVSVLEGRQTLIEERLGALGVKRNSKLSVPYFSSAITPVIGTSLIATIPRRVAMPYINHEALKICPPPMELLRFSYLMVWHPRTDNDPALQWLRNTVRGVADSLAVVNGC